MHQLVLKLCFASPRAIVDAKLAAIMSYIRSSGPRAYL